MGLVRRREARRSPRRRALTSVLLVLVLLGGAQAYGALLLPGWLLPAAATATAPATSQAPVVCTGGALQVVAHEDDDLLFLSPDLLHDVQAGRCVRTVVVTTGDAARGTAYWHGRELGSRAAYARMAGVPDEWTTSDAGIPGHPAPLLTLTADPRVSLVFLRLPDGNRRGTGMQVHDHESLMRLWQGLIPTISAVDDSSTYTADTLTTALTTLVDAFRPTTVRTQDWTIPFQTGDNADHTATALFVREADRGTTTPHVLLAYGGYPMWTRMPNVGLADLRGKTAAFVAYAHHDSLMCLEPWCADSVVAALRLSRQYVVASQTTGDVPPR